MSKQPVGLAPITMPTIGVTLVDGVVAQVFIDRLVTITGPAGVVGRHAWLLLTPDQAEVLVRELGAKLGLEVVGPASHRPEPGGRSLGARSHGVA